MRSHFLGGAAEVGASCLLIEASGRRILVDAGIRMQAGDALPDLSRLQELGGVDVVVVTHAHADHIGALPLAAGAFPSAPVFATPATAALMSVMLEDSVRIGERRAESEGDLPPYGRPHVEALLERVVPLRFLQPRPLFADTADSWQLTLFPAGHVLGAAMVLLETPEGSILVSGDVSVGPQSTVAPALPPRRGVDVLILESTYGNRLHSQRAAEEQRLITQIKEVIGRGGHCLIPAFALGRAQEVLLVLAAARRRGELDVPIWVDGLVRAVCGVYQAHAESGRPTLRRLVERQGNPFFSGDGPARPIQHPEQREQILQGQPSVIISSSGMLQGGPSALYAAKLASDERHAILITGYQDEESPGRRLLDLSREVNPEARRLILNGVETKVACAVSRYNLSAHADGDELAALAERVRPGLTLLVHGDGEARAALAEKLTQRGVICRLPANGEAIELSGTSSSLAVGASEPPEPTDEDVVQLARKLGASRAWTALELAERYYGQITAKGVAAIERILEGSAEFEPDRLRPLVYHLRFVSLEPLAGRTTGPLGQERLRQRLEIVFRDDPTMLKLSFHTAEHAVEIRFAFPHVASERYQDVLSKVESESGWRIGIRPTPDQAALQLAAKRHLPSGLQVLATPSVHVAEKRLVVRVDGEASAEDVFRAQAGFRAETGFELSFRGDSFVDSEAKAVSPTLVLESLVTQPSESAMDSLEINNTYASIREAFLLLGVTIYKVGRKNDAVQVTFLTPLVGRRWQAELARLAGALGWPLAIDPQPQQGAVFEFVRQVVGRRIAKGPSLFAAEQKVRVRLLPDDAPDAAQLLTWQKVVETETGYALEVDFVGGGNPLLSPTPS